MTSEQEKQIRALKSLLIVVSDPEISELFANYAEINYNNALERLKSGTTPIEIGRAQGEANTWFHLMRLKEKVMDTVNKAGK